MRDFWTRFAAALLARVVWEIGATVHKRRKQAKLRAKIEQGYETRIHMPRGPIANAIIEDIRKETRRRL